jgi:hypothetical protein
MNDMKRVAPVVLALLFSAEAVTAEPVSVRYPEAEARARLRLRMVDGAALADGQWNQTVDGPVVTTRVVFRFKDGSLHDETVVFSQGGRLRVLRDRLVQRGPAFPNDIDLFIDATTGEVVVMCREKGGRETRYAERFALPADLSNGIVPTVLKNVRPESPPKSVSLLVATPAPRVVQLVMAPPARERVSSAARSGFASHYVLKVQIGGLAGRLAPLVGKQPPDSHVWIADGDPPVFVRSEQPFYVGGPLWRIDVVK